MINRRRFLETAIAAAAASHARPLFASETRGIQGANDRIRVGIIGCGNRGNQVATDWMKHKDTMFVAAAEVAKDRLDSTAARLGETQGNKLDTYEDYHRILERKDIDAVLIATPDHWHSPMTIEAIAAGKDVYCEKPVSNEIEPAVKMLEAVRKSNRIVQIGTQQRSWHHFQEAAKLFHENYIGTSVNHCQMCPPGGGGGAAAASRRSLRARSPFPRDSTGRCSRDRPSGSRSCPGAAAGAVGTTTAAETSRTGASTSPTS